MLAILIFLRFYVCHIKVSDEMRCRAIFPKQALTDRPFADSAAIR